MQNRENQSAKAGRAKIIRKVGGVNFCKVARPVDRRAAFRHTPATKDFWSRNSVTAL
jgi:hypothetical protein